MLDKSEVRDVVAAAIGVPPESVGYEDDLVGLGMHSMQLMKLSATWRKQGREVRSSELALEPTIAAWTRLLAAAEPAAPVARQAAAESVEPGGEFGLATMQHAYWMGRRGDQRLGGVAAHLYVEFDGHGVRADRLERAVARLVARHDQLRAQFLDSGTQRVLPAPPQLFGTVDLTGSADPDAELERLRQDKSHQRMDVEQGRVVDITLSLLPGGRHRLHLDVDMLAADAQSYRRILDDLARLYETDTGSLEPIGYTFRDYLADKERTAADNTADREWWAERLGDMPDIPALPVVPETERADPTRSIRLHHWFDADTRARLQRHAYGNGVTPAVALATVFAEVIARWSVRQRFLLNIPLFAREPLHDEIDSVVGDFTNSVLVDVDATRPESMTARAERLQRALHTCAAHARYEGLDVLRDLGRLRGAPVTPSVVFTSGLDLGELFSDRVTRIFGEPVWILSQGPQVDLDAQVAEVGGGLLVNWDIRRDALPEGVAAAMFDQFRSILDSLAEPDADWSAPLAITLPEQQRAVRGAANETAADFGPRTLHESFFEQAERDPHRTALGWRSGSLTYGELAGQALAVAGALRAAGVRPGATVAVIVPKGYRQIPAVLGVLAAGATYLPIGTGQPAARRERILRRGGARVALVDGATELPDEVTALPLERALSGTPLARPRDTDTDGVAYVLFTSGSTGEPKGVEVGHRAAANTIDAIGAHFGLDSGDRTIALSSLEFDLSVFDIFAPLALGGAVVCVDDATERDAMAWSALIEQHAVTVVNCAPGLVAMLADTATADRLASVRLVITGGDRVQAELGHRLRALVPGLRFAGLGGTTETAIHSTVYEVTDEFPAGWATVPYGVPLANVALRVVNERGEDCPDQVLGELWIGGLSVADGYRGDPGRTADRFVELDGTRWYRTGDLARYLPGGTVEFLGRADHQVKIRGYRVELGEVESALASLPDIRAAVALVTGSGRLVAAAVATPGADPVDPAAWLGELLPAHMIPESVRLLDEMPLTANGKSDRAAIRSLFADADTASTAGYIEPDDDIEAALAYIAAQVLGLPRLGVETDFFDAGGNSILATTLTARIRSLLAVTDFGVTVVLEARTVRGIGTVLRAADTSGRLARVARILLEVAAVGASEGMEVA
ncbi:non-ribosomal peptide synthetase [Nocardia jinanensis]|uniref:Phenyloxazoline synthase MbtB n=1 Tax=Nocardia jinanensis TaxID=382504 RepID=A0A917RS09_9NOCA|nr:non-ribosomal peptide synthetase [Nocardia jinanensis]GGL23309.1 putative phenyloxazoline synthase MbtB [Nocardia jinanensis]